MKILMLLSLLTGWLLDLLLGDPARLPHPVVAFGRAIGWCERHWNRGHHRKLKGTFTAIGLVSAVFILTALLIKVLQPETLWQSIAYFIFHLLVIFFCLAGTTLIREVRAVFLALDRSLEEGRQQVARIVGRDTSELSVQEVRTAALETLAENLSDGVIAPLFWLALLGAPGMLAYKMINTLDSMIGYRTSRYREFGCFAARLDDVANYLPARLTALLMVVADSLIHRKNRHQGLLAFIRRYARCHASPNSGWPESALAGILNCRFGGPHTYFGEVLDKPFIGDNPRLLDTNDMKKAVRINRIAEVMMVILSGLIIWLNPLF